MHPFCVCRRADYFWHTCCQTADGKSLREFCQASCSWKLVLHSYGHLVLQDENKASLSTFKRSKGLGVGGTRKRLRLVEHESKRLQQVCRACRLTSPQVQGGCYADRHATACLMHAVEISLMHWHVARPLGAALLLYSDSKNRVRCLQAFCTQQCNCCSVEYACCKA